MFSVSILGVLQSVKERGDAMANLIEEKIQELVSQYGYSEQVLRDLVDLAQSQSKQVEKNKKDLTKVELQSAVAAAFGCSDIKELKKGEAFQQAIAGRGLKLDVKSGWLTLYRERVLGEEVSPLPPLPPKELTKAELESAVTAAFNCKDVKELKKYEAFKLAIAGRDLNLRKKDAWFILYREWVGVPENERHEEGPHCINGIDILKNFRPWHVFNLDPKTATSDDINKAFRQLAHAHHPDHGGERDVFERLQKMRDSLLAFR